MLSEEQKAMRRTGIGSSDVAAILGISPFRTAFDVYVEKVDGFESEQTEWQEIGDLLEPVVLELYRRRRGLTTDHMERPGTIRHMKHSWVVDSPDAIAALPDGWRAVEAKAPRYLDKASWGDAGSDVIEEAYIIQAQWHLETLRHATGLTPFDVCDVPVLFGGSDFRIFEVKRDAELAGMLIEECGKFWRDHIEARRPPKMDGSRHAPAWLAKRFPRDARPLIEATVEEEALVTKLQAAVRERDAAEAVFETLKNQTKERIGDAAGISTSLGAITWKSNAKGVRTFRTPKHWSKHDE